MLFRSNLLPALTALDNVLAPVLPYRTRWDKRERARELLAAVGLAGREQSLPARMSGGEQQRVAIARALVGAPSLLLADEPTGNLDTQNAAEIMDLLARLRAERGMTVLLASHDTQVAARAERLIRLRDGAVTDDIDLADGYPADEVARRAGQRGQPGVTTSGGMLNGVMTWTGAGAVAMGPSSAPCACMMIWQARCMSRRRSG